MLTELDRKSYKCGQLYLNTRYLDTQVLFFPVNIGKNHYNDYACIMWIEVKSTRLLPIHRLGDFRNESKLI